MSRESLPYKLEVLQWDPQHHFNSQNRYGYTGRGRKLADPVLQCEGCMQWFHAREVSCLAPSMGFLPFQRNYRFSCRICSEGDEQLELLPNTWSSIATTALYNLLLSDDGHSLNDSRRWIAIDEVREWIKSHWGSLTHGRKMSQLTENRAVHKALELACSYGEVNMSADKREVALRNTQTAKLKLKPLMNSTVAAGVALPKKEREGAPGKRKRGGRGGVRNVVSASTPAAEIKLPDKYRLVPAPRLEQNSAAQDAAAVQLSRAARAPQITLRDDLLSAVGCKGYRMIRATHGVRAGAWYFEVRVGTPISADDAHTRLGWSTEMGELQARKGGRAKAPVGYDKNSYAYRDIGGTKFHESQGSPYGESYGAGDVVGCMLQMGDPPASVRQRQRITIKGVEYIVEEDVQRTASRGSRIVFYKNGVSQGVAFSDIWAEVYYPAASMYKDALVTFNFGPHFDHFPSESGARPCCELAQPDATDTQRAASDGRSSPPSHADRPAGAAPHADAESSVDNSSAGSENGRMASPRVSNGPSAAAAKRSSGGDSAAAGAGGDEATSADTASAAISC